MLGLVLFVVGGLLVVVWVGIFLVAAAVPLIRVIANRQRHIAGRVLGVDLPPPYRPLPERGPLVRLVAMLTDPMTWRDVLWIVWAIGFGWVMSLLVVVLLLGVVTGFFWWFGTYPILWTRSVVDRAFLSYSNTETLERRVAALTQSRAAAVDHSAAELRRLERDLHDGTQARLVAVSMSLGMAEELFESDPDGGAAYGQRGPGRDQRRDRRPALGGARHPPAGARRPRARRRDPGAGPRHGRAGRGRRRAARAGRPRRSSRRSTSRSPSASPTPPSTPATARRGSSCATSAGCSGWWSATTGAAAPTSTPAPACGG